MVLAAGIFLLLKRQKLARQQDGTKSTARVEKSQTFHEAPPSEFRNELDARQVTELDGGRLHHEMQ